ncbi:glycosyltransferase [Nitratiruptor tergarcus]|uniref:Glycosyltransferase involved in cell wall bisynthesis n=1 Tax=Nitratiruptor tergarcus DSM 16512 TaxID=1069081 RepID=A0A1W1WSN2_9BACT|nr:glycosyltransferase [Nitratiruptor tergarcus]SMC09307.1 Glycosyltransferase involved in cell wall bisynthesis [Nitratiruptor tergarcus DSM 16512]
MQYQLEDLEQILSFINLNYPLNRLGGWAASADFMKIVYRELLKKIRNKKDLIIVECGSGVSTILMAYLLKEHSPNSKIISLDHSYDYLKKTENELKLHNLLKFVEPLYAPLKYYLIDEDEWLWYDISQLHIDAPIDILLVDGPPMDTQPLARYPALPLLYSYLNNETVILLDDAHREEERKIVEKWLRDDYNLRSENYETQKGTAKLYFKKNSYEPLITIAIPTYNRKEFLREALQSALNQNYENYEIVVVDDGSDVDMQEVIEEFNSPKIRFFANEKNRGRPYTRNRCIEEARGEYILWLDDDDKLMPNILQKYVDLLNDVDITPDVVYGNLNSFGEQELRFTPLDFFENGDTLLQMLYEGKGSYIPNLGSMVKTILYTKIGKYDERFERAQDFEFWIRVAKTARFKKLNNVVALWRIHLSNTTNGENSVYYADRSYESLAMRLNLKYYRLEEIFYHFDDMKDINQKLSSSLIGYFDGLNALYYGFEYISQSEEIARMKFSQALQCDNLTIAKYALQHVKENEKLRKLLKRYQKIKKLLMRENIDGVSLRGFENFWLFYYTLALKSEDIRQAKNFARAAYLLNPLKLESQKVAKRFGVETKAIDRRIKVIANSYEENKNEFIQKYWS